MNVVLFLSTLALVACAMEAWAALLHGRVWHQALWSIHRSHHEPRRGRFERNDALSSLHAPLAAALIVGACLMHPSPARALIGGVGAGMTAFGVGYLLCHDGFVHGRLPLGFLARFDYFVRVRQAHRRHHADGAAPYGFFAAPFSRDPRATEGSGPEAGRRRDHAIEHSGG